MNNDVALQPILSSSSALFDPGAEVRPHHPVTCTSPLRYDESVGLACDHAAVPPDDPRTRFCVTYSVALLLIELVHDL